ncbi:MAG: GyrI-like domain-containing protein [Bacteroidota bacterium]
MPKHEWRKREKHLYLPKQEPTYIEIPGFSFLTISGAGNPNGATFTSCVQALYAVCYAIKMNAKKLADPPAGYQDYTVYPLEGVWDLSEAGRAAYDGGPIDKDELVFQLMIRQPDFVSREFYEEMRTLAHKKKPNPQIEKLRFERLEEGPCVHMMHLGSFDDEPASFERMEAFTEKQQLRRLSKVHREIYLSDPRRTAEEKLKTVLRFEVAKR